MMASFMLFLAGAEEHLLPQRNSLDEGGEEEERRLFHVAVDFRVEAFNQPRSQLGSL